MWWEKWADERITDAIAQGEFDNLLGRAQPIDHDRYFAAPPHLRSTYNMLRNAGVLPPGAALLKEIAMLRVSLEACCDPQERVQLNKTIQEKKLAYNLIVERY